MNSSTNIQTISIRLADERDITDIARLAGELGYPSTPEQVHERFAAIQTAPHHATFVAVTNSEAVIGWIGLSVERSVLIEARAEITGLVVDSCFRSLGAGRLLVERGEEWARHKGLVAIGVRSNITRERTHLFYTRLGYVTTKSQKVFRKPL